jgi:translation initiation factor IF-1
MKNKKPFYEKSLAFVRPDLAMQWHSTKNGELTTNDVTCGSEKLIWWQCEKGHEWQATIYNRQRNSESPCPYCTGRKVCKDNCLSTMNPELAKQWHPTKNKKLTPEDITCGTHVKVWWKCNDCNYEWFLSVSSRQNLDCPKCGRKKGIEKRNKNLILKKGSFATNKPDLIKLWNFKKNKTLTPFDVLCNSNKKVWWQCENGHEWETAVSSINNGHNCPYCCGQKSTEENCLVNTHPEISKEWHPTKNKDLTPYDVSAGSGKRIWWQCEKGHEWDTFIYNRTKENAIGCPFCLNRKSNIDNSLAICNPDLAKQWHPSKNGILSTDSVVYGSGKKVWWICEFGHEWEARIVDRVTKSYGCPFCSNRKLTIENCLETKRPDLAKQWHPNKNGILTPRDVHSSTDIKVWWQCEKGHEWKAQISNRNSGKGCPKCGCNKISYQQLCIYYYLQKLFNETILDYKTNDNIEADVYIPNINLAIEYDGWYWHKDRKNKDILKNKYFSENKINLIRIRENKLPVITQYNCLNFQISKEPTSEELKFAIMKILEYIKNNYQLTKRDVLIFNKLVKNINIDAEKFFILQNKSYIEKKNSLESMNNVMAKEWHPTKNGILKPGNFRANSHMEVWWQCVNGHEWKARIKERYRTNITGSVLRCKLS